MKRVILYKDEYSDEFSPRKLKSRFIDGKYRYISASPARRLVGGLLYYGIFAPVGHIYLSLKFAHRTVGRKKLRGFVKSGYFLMGNHTQDIADAFIPHLAVFGRMKNTVANPSNLTIPIIGGLLPLVGVLPLPCTVRSAKSFNDAVCKSIKDGRAVIIYPEGHIWPYYTGIRPFSDACFDFDCKTDAPIFTFTNVYLKRRLSSRPRIVTYIDGPFYPQRDIKERERRKELRDRVYGAMCRRAALSEVEFIKYIKDES